MTAIVTYTGNGSAAVPALSIGDTIASFGHLSGEIANTDFVPTSMRGKPAVVLACMMYGAELGLGPMQSLNMIQSIQGTVGLKPEGMRALVTQKGHRIWVEEYTDTAVTYCGWRRGDPADAVVRARFTIADAERAQLMKGGAWSKYPRAMLSARATAELCRLHFADVIGGLSYTPEEIADFDDPPVMASSVPIQADENGEVIPAPVALPTSPTTRRRPPPGAPAVPDGHVSTAEGKARLIAAYEGTGLDVKQATNCAAVYWQAHGLNSEPVPVEVLERMVADVAASARTPGDDEPEAA